MEKPVEIRDLHVLFRKEQEFFEETANTGITEFSDKTHINLYTASSTPALAGHAPRASNLYWYRVRTNIIQRIINAKTMQSKFEN